MGYGLLGCFCVLNLWCRKALSTEGYIALEVSIPCVESLMPKGVEHMRLTHKMQSDRNGVESLMPKGVEHRLKDCLQAKRRKCWISDAERRWALGCFQVLPEYCTCWISDAERRWAHIKILLKGCLFMCWISDAERRWAHVTAMGLVTKFGCWISDAERRWAPINILKIIRCSLECWISDAERRWARIENYNSGGYSVVLNLWCRKALSTDHKIKRES